jgi:alkanesulfonate monooxygenase SsuD/methylene tetrahydromethanopterin reductase-like flavin-dependent oxidoreductase (luciferase family)
MWIAAGGPRSLGVAARHADTLVYCLGPDPTLIGVIRDKLDEEAKAAGRDPSEIKLSALTWFYAMKPGDTLDDAVNQGFGSGPISSCITNAGLMREHVDLLGEEIVSAAEEAAGTYLSIPPDGSSHYLDIWRKYLNGLDPRHAKIVSKQLCDYFCLYGTPEELQEKVSVMQDAGVDSVSLFLANPMTFERDIEDISGLVGARV